MQKNKLRWAAGVLTVLTAAVFAYPAVKVRGDVNSAVQYLNSKTANPWSTMALYANGGTPDVAYLQNVPATKAIDLEAPIMAMAAAGKDPASFAGRDLVAELKSYASGGQIGDATTLNDDIFGLLALEAAGVPASDGAISNTRAFLSSHQNADGGWAFSAGGTSDTNTTAAGIMAMLATGSPASDAAIVNALNYLHSAQNADGGFPYDPQSQWGTDSDASSDAWIIMALNAAGIDPHSWSKSGGDPLSSLLGFQDASGYFKYQASSSEDNFSPVTTSYAVTALLGKSYPVKIFSSSAAELPSVSFRIEGSANQVCSGTAAAANALDVVKRAAEQCGFTYHIQSSSYGEYLDQVGSEAAAGDNGWLYFVNYVSPSVGAADYSLKSGDEVLWYFGSYTWKPMRLSLSATELTPGNAVTATVESLEGGSWQPVSGAAVNGAGGTFTTGADGKVVWDVSAGTFYVYAEHSGYVRSGKIRLLAGAQSGSLDLSLNLTGENSTSTESTVSFSVDSDGAKSVNFGSAGKGQTLSRPFTLKNGGTARVRVSANVTGDDLFRNFLKLDSVFWTSFAANLDAGQNKTANATLTVPSNYSGSGQKTGSLIFWATLAN